ncbi:uncharacterized protein LOC143292817 isoform X2 [Babylonia areolata]|uniref:uncharacterized protein LOC143292817 isoform X2 n=1 Tax=Babylonia areolata TaxID=304850 RepID=UPI003FD43086
MVCGHRHAGVAGSSSDHRQVRSKKKKKKTTTTTTTEERLLRAGPVHQPSQCCQPGDLCTMRRPSDPPPSPPPPPPPPRPPPGSSQPRPWLRLLHLALPLLFVCLFAHPCVGASAGAKRDGGGPPAAKVCRTEFTDVESSALLAEVVLEGRVREKVFPKASPAEGYYNVSVQVRKQVWKGRELINRGKRARKLLLGTFLDVSKGDDADGKVVSGGGGGGGGGGDDEEDEDGGEVSWPVTWCAGQVEDGATYIFFLRTAGDLKGRYFQLSAMPVKKNRRESRRVGKILKKNAAQKPSIQRLKAPRQVTSGSSLTLRCKAKAKPTALFSWYHDGRPLKSGRGLRIKSNKRGSRLKISKAKDRSAGVYTCKAANAVGEASKDVTVKVIKAKSIHKPCEKQTYCFNGGSCRYLPDLQQAFCQCPKSYEGKRCEKEVARPVTGAASLEYERVLIIVGIVIAFLVFLVICIASYFLAKRRRQRWVTRRRMKQNAGRERDRLLDEADGIQQPRGLLKEKETQTDTSHHPPDLPPKLEPGNRANFIHTTPLPADSPFHMDDHFPVITTSSAATHLTSHPPGVNGRKAGRAGSGREAREVERRGSRSRLKAVSVDDSCKDRPPSWRAEADVPGRETQPLVGAGQAGSPPELIEMDDLTPSPDRPTDPRPVEEEEEESPLVEGLPGFLSSFSSPGQGEAPIKMGTPPKDNAHAQLKTPEEQSFSNSKSASDYDVPKPSAHPANVDTAFSPDRKEAEPIPSVNSPREPSEPRVLAINGALPGLDSEDEEGGKTLPMLHISEEDLNRNLSKAGTTDMLPLSAAAAHRPGHQPSVMADGVGVDGVGVGVDGRLQPTVCDDDCGGFLPHALRDSLRNPSPRELYSFDPAMDSDSDDADQFMHGSPKKSLGGCSAGEVQQDYERRLRNVRTDQEPIPI